MAEGTAIGQIISDRQALMALLAIRNNVQLGQEVKDSVAKSDGATETSYKVIADTNDFKTEKAKAQFEFGQMEGLSGFNNALGSTAETLSEYMSKYPDLTAAVASAGTGIAALGAAALSAAGAISLLGRKNSGGLGGFDIGDFGGKNNGGSKAGGKGFGFGWLAKAGLVAELALHSNELNAGEDEMVAARFEKMQASGNMYVTPKNQQAVNSAPPFAMGIAQMASQIGTVTAQQSAMQGEVSSVNHVLSQYQADFNAFGQKISDGIQAGLAAQSHTIDNRITVELDGAVIAENVSQRQFNYFNRGVA